jgi:NADP-dependent 3-hydroxy acid dehydrogenase YdfG
MAPETVAEAVKYVLEQPAVACVDELVLAPTRGPIELK